MINEVGCIHIVQGYDLNYVGVIVGPELTYGAESGLAVIRTNYKDRNGKAGIRDKSQLRQYILTFTECLCPKESRAVIFTLLIKT